MLLLLTVVVVAPELKLGQLLLLPVLRLTSAVEARHLQQLGPACSSLDAPWEAKSLDAAIVGESFGASCVTRSLATSFPASFAVAGDSDKDDGFEGRGCCSGLLLPISVAGHLQLLLAVVMAGGVVGVPNEVIVCLYNNIVFKSVSV